MKIEIIQKPLPYSNFDMLPVGRWFEARGEVHLKRDFYSSFLIDKDGFSKVTYWTPEERTYSVILLEIDTLKLKVPYES